MYWFRTLRKLVAVAAILSLPALLSANPLQGKDDPALQSAINLWLDNNDADSLTKFSTLAKTGNRAARMLLARIERTERAPSDFLERMTKSERMELFRCWGVLGDCHQAQVSNAKFKAMDLAQAMKV